MHIQKRIHGTLLGILLCAPLCGITMHRSKTLEQTHSIHRRRSLLTPPPLLLRESSSSSTGSLKNILTELVYLGNFKCIQEVLADLSADELAEYINQRDPYGLTPLMLASSAIQATTHMVELLISYGALLHLTDHRGHNAYSLAVSAGNIDIARYIYEKSLKTF